MTANLKTFSLALVAAVTNGIATSQSLGSAGPLTINGSLASGGVATFDVARRVGITSAGNDSGITWTITGTDRYGRLQSEVLTGATATNTAQSVKDYLTVTSIVGSAASASTVTSGTTTVASTVPMVVDYFANPTGLAAALVFTGVANATIEVSNDDVWPDYNVNANPPVYFGAQGFTAVSSNTAGPIGGPITLLRLTVNSGTGSVSARVNQAFIAGGA